MSIYHVEILDPVEIVVEGVRARSGRAAVEIALRSAGIVNYRYAWSQNSPVDVPPGKRPICPVYTDGCTYIHTVAWRETA